MKNKSCDNQGAPRLRGARQNIVIPEFSAWLTGRPMRTASARAGRPRVVVRWTRGCWGLGPGTMPRGKYPESPAPAGSHALISRTPTPGGMLHAPSGGAANLGLPRPPPRNFQPPLPQRLPIQPQKNPHPPRRLGGGFNPLRHGALAGVRLGGGREVGPLAGRPQEWSFGAVPPQERWHEGGWSSSFRTSFRVSGIENIRNLRRKSRGGARFPHRLLTTRTNRAAEKRIQRRTIPADIAL